MIFFIIFPRRSIYRGVRSNSNHSSLLVAEDESYTHTLLKMEACKEYLLNRLNSHFRIDYDGFFYENEKYDFSQITQFIEEARKFTGYRFKLGFVCDDSNDFESNEDSPEKEEEEEEEDDGDDENTEQNSEGRSDSEAEMNADSGEEEEEEEEEETMCPECHRQYSSKSNLSRHMKSQH
jgi:hypothetical protein